MSRAEFSAKTQAAALQRANGICECGCGRPLQDPNDAKSKPEYDHIIEDMLHGGADLENCQCIRLDCHRLKTKTRAPVLAKVRREDKRKAGIRAKKRKISYQRFNGDPVWK